jgi:hypothetical protein
MFGGDPLDASSAFDSLSLVSSVLTTSAVAAGAWLLMRESAALEVRYVSFLRDIVLAFVALSG